MSESGPKLTFPVMRVDCSTTTESLLDSIRGRAHRTRLVDDKALGGSIYDLPGADKAARNDKAVACLNRECLPIS